MAVDDESLELDIWRVLAGAEGLDAGWAQLGPRLAARLGRVPLLWVSEGAGDSRRLSERSGGSGRFLAGQSAQAVLEGWQPGAGTRTCTGSLVGLLPPGAKGGLALPLHHGAQFLGLLVAPGEPTDFRAAEHTLLAALGDAAAAALAHSLRELELSERRAAAEAERQALLDRLGRTSLEQEPVVGAQAGLAGVLERVGLVATSDVPVLLLGETGSGKEVIARAIHQGSARHAGPFLRVNCAAIAPELVDSQLFGHEKGSFTGATARREGWFERAHGGTLFLDEVGELSPAAQVRLLRVLQDGTLERVGGESTVHVDCRIVAATHRDLPGLVQAATFRQDLWYRIAVFPIVIPPLRERRADIPALVQHFARRAARRFGLPECAADSADLELLMRYPWPGNVRELGAVVDRAAILGLGKRLAFGAALGPPLPAAPSTASQPAAVASTRTEFPTLDEAMRRHMEDALRLSRGRIEGPQGAAQLLGVNPHTLRARLRKLRVDWPQFRSKSGA